MLLLNERYPAQMTGTVVKGRTYVITKHEWERAYSSRGSRLTNRWATVREYELREIRNGYASVIGKCQRASVLKNLVADNGGTLLTLRQFQKQHPDLYDSVVY